MSWAEQKSISMFCIIGKELKYAEVVLAGGGLCHQGRVSTIRLLEGHKGQTQCFVEIFVYSFFIRLKVLSNVG